MSETEEKQIDTSTAEGHRLVCEHVWNGGEYELLTPSGKWAIGDITPMEWFPTILRRIKQKRIPKVGEVWKDREGEICGITKIIGDWCEYIHTTNDSIRTSYTTLNMLIEYIGDIDLSLLKENTK